MTTRLALVILAGGLVCTSIAALLQQDSYTLNPF